MVSRSAYPRHNPGRLPPADANARPATKADVEAHFATHGTGEITEIKLMNGFGFIEYKDAMDARDVVPGEPPTLSSHLSPTTGLFVLFANHAGALAFRTLAP
jgi:hypothetical protein